MTSATPTPGSSPPPSRLVNKAERALFSRRPWWLAFFAIVSCLMLWQASLLKADASFQKMVPGNHPFVLNSLRFINELRPLGNTVRIAVETTDGDIYSREYLEVLRKITDEVFYIPGIDRGNLKSLWTPNTLWFEATEDGLRSGKVIPADFSSISVKQDAAIVRDNVAKAGLVGTLVANDHRSSVILAPLLENDPDTGAHLDYGQFSERLEAQLRQRYESKTIRIHIVGFAKLVGDLIHGAASIGLFFLLTVGLTAILLWAYSRCWRVTLVTIGCCLLAVLWHLGLMHLLGFGLDPYSILVPFLTFAIGVSHAVQNINTFASASAQGASKLSAAKATFALLFVPGTVALLCDVVGFSTMWMIDIGVIRELAISASVGVGVIIFTKMFLLPIAMSYAGMSARGLKAAKRRQAGPHRLGHALASLATGWRAWGVLGVAGLVAATGYAMSRQLEIGDLDPGAPELRPSSVYNKDIDFFARHYATSTDVFVVMVKTPAGECGAYPTASTVTQLQWALEETPGVQSTVSLFDWMKQVIAGTYGGNLKWAAVTRNRYISNSAHKAIPQSFYNDDCSMLPVVAYLADHKAATLNRVVKTVEGFVSSHSGTHVEILMAAGNAGIESATNAVVEKAWRPMLWLVYAIVAVLLMLEFRSLRVTLCLLIPLVITSILCEAVMAAMGLGVKVATLPVIALGVGIGVDYGIYLYNRLEQYLHQGLSLPEAYLETMKTTGLAVAFTGISLAAGVATWVMSDIKFQADMGLLLTFMFLWNMIGAVLLIPALAKVMGLGHAVGKANTSAPSASKPSSSTHRKSSSQVTKAGPADDEDLALQTK
ncbi:MAG: RND family transporter [Aquabacterium sp.]|uniref:efflux RND transporter permease subunit n=1 Tax=Aquabacterium sp. TaxID=1872578 RepID=UPI0025BF0210|nr:MMPL family transporter [Aquabacterium sp.]MBI3381833.1 RND family transporter [Aquabacterium sp.]